MWQQKKEREEATLPDPTVPDGHVVMPTADRLKTLEALQHSTSYHTHPVQIASSKFNCQHAAKHADGY